MLHHVYEIVLMKLCIESKSVIMLKTDLVTVSMKLQLRLA
jgi:hypothetical protein